MTTESEESMTAHQNSLASIESQGRGTIQGQKAQSHPKCYRTLVNKNGLTATACRTIGNTEGAAI